MRGVHGVRTWVYIASLTARIPPGRSSSEQWLIVFRINGVA